MSKLILVRHGVTDWNIEGKWHGWIDIPLNEEGRKQARETAKALKGIKIESVYTSDLSRTVQTYEEICNELNLVCPVIKEPVLKERHYGIYTGKNKWQVKKEVGKERFFQLRRGFNYPIPEGESLKDVYERVVLYYRGKISKDLKNGKNVLIVSSGNSLRALIKYLEKISDEDISELELNFGEVYIYEINSIGEVIGKEIRASNLYKEKLR